MPTTDPARVPDPGAARFPVVDPATGDVFDEAPDQQPDELDAVIDRAQRSWSGWRTDPAARTTALRAAADAVEAAGEVLARSLTREQGKPLAESYAEVARTAARLRYFADLAPRTRPIDDGRPVRSEIRWRSLGPVAAIVPWNSLCSSRRRSSRPLWPPATPSSSNPLRSPRWPPACWGRSSPPSCRRTS
ncbi:Gamma-aminobutyraldehyde dehydrogenase [Streptomyces tendae]